MKINRRAFVKGLAAAAAAVAVPVRFIAKVAGEEWIDVARIPREGPWKGYLAHSAMFSGHLSADDLWSLVQTYQEKILALNPTLYWPLDGSGRIYRSGFWVQGDCKEQVEFFPAEPVVLSQEEGQ